MKPESVAKSRKSAFWRMLKVVLCIGILLIGLAVGVYFLIPHWIAAGFYGYFGFGLFVWLLQFRRRTTPSQTPFNQTGVLTLYKEREKLISSKPVRFYRALPGNLYAFAFVMGSWLAFPFIPAVWKQLRGVGNTLKMEHDEDWFPYHIASLWNLALMCALTALKLLGVSGQGYGRLSAAMLLGVTVLALTSFALGNESFLANIRRYTLYPWVTFTLIAVAQLTTLGLGFTILHTGSMTSGFYFAFLESMRGILDFSRLIQLVRFEWLSRFELAECLTGLLFYAGLARHLQNYRDFERRESDYIQLALDDAMSGNFYRVHERLSHVQHRDDDSAVLASFVASVGLGQYRHAADNYMRRRSSMLGRSVDFSEMFDETAGLFILRAIEDKTAEEWLAFCINEPVRDSSLLAWSTAISMMGRNSKTTTAFKALITSRRDRFPLAGCAVWAQEGDQARLQANECLRGTIEPVLVERIIRDMLLAMTSVGSTPETFSSADGESIQEWLRTTFPLLNEEIDQIHDPYEITLVFRWLVLFGAALRLCGQQGDDAVLRKAATLMDRLPGDPFTGQRLGEFVQMVRVELKSQKVDIPALNEISAVTRPAH